MKTLNKVVVFVAGVIGALLIVYLFNFLIDVAVEFFESDIYHTTAYSIGKFIWSAMIILLIIRLLIDAIKKEETYTGGYY